METKEELRCVTSQLSANVGRLIESSTSLARTFTHDNVIVSKRELERLVTEVMQMKEFLPKIAGKRHIRALSKGREYEQELHFRRSQVLALQQEKKHAEKRIDVLQAELEKQKEENYAAKCEISELREQLADQSNFCSTMGASACTLLWRLSRIESSVDAILSGTMVESFFDVIVVTMTSCLATYPLRLPADQSDEGQFILSLCGIITNIAASPSGREFLATSASGRTVLDCMIRTLSDAPTRPAARGDAGPVVATSSDKMCCSSRLKNLILMGLYNVSINRNGLDYLTSKSELLSILGGQLKGSKDAENVTNCLRLLQSLLLEPKSKFYTQEALRAIPSDLLGSLTKNRNPEVSSAARELLSDIEQLPREEREDDDDEPANTM
ncbi:heat shock factor 2-binding protein-like isoform X2 [Oscarella lobularis]|uniref:heat shock factor 2-binding protein-like isoform X2 n=1 Tax=Oscarella lobularis TaxID=121494 RepID=UPI0033130C41